MLDIAPIAKPRMTKSDKWKHRKIVEDYWKFKDEIKKICLINDFKLSDKYRIRFVLPMPQTWASKKKALCYGAPHKQRPDLDNLIKAINDCLHDEDSGVYYIEASKIWGTSGYIYIENL